MRTYELRDAEEARLFLLQGFWLQRLLPPAAAHVRPVFEWALEVAAGGQPLPPVGFVADVGHAAFGLDWEVEASREGPAVPGFSGGLARAYEDHVLGKLYADWTFARAGDALRRYRGRDRARALAFVLNQFRERAGFDGAGLSPAVIKGLLEAPPEDVVARGWESLQRDGLRPPLAALYQALVAAARRSAEVLGPEDLFELEHGTALDELGQRLALRQVLQAAARLEAGLPRHRPRPPARRRDVPTHVLEEDTYPVGGYASLATRGSLESLLHSQLAYMEPGGRPDLFDVKFLRDELLYYARDENQFLRQRRTYAFALFPDLVHTRFKDAALPYQRGVLLLGLLAAAVRRLTEWLGADALTFLFLFVGDDQEGPLAPERKTLEQVLREGLANGTVEVRAVPDEAAVVRECARRARRSQCHCLSVATAARLPAAEDSVVARLCVDGPVPALGVGAEAPARPEAEGPLEGWAAALQALLQRWV